MMDVYAAWARFHMHTFGTTREQIAAVAAKNHAHSIENPHLAVPQAYSVEEVLSAPPITYPLTLPMCAPISDGAAAAVIVARERALERFDRRRADEDARLGLMSGTDRRPEEVEKHIGRRAALKAYAEAGVGPETCRSPRCTTRPRWARSCRSRTSASVPSAMGGRRRRAVRLGSAGASREPVRRPRIERASDRRDGTRPALRADAQLRGEAGRDRSRRALRDRRERRWHLRHRGSRLLRHDPRRADASSGSARRAARVPLCRAASPCSTMS